MPRQPTFSAASIGCFVELESRLSSATTRTLPSRAKSSESWNWERSRFLITVLPPAHFFLFAAEKVHRSRIDTTTIAACSCFPCKTAPALPRSSSNQVGQLLARAQAARKAPEDIDLKLMQRRPGFWNRRMARRIEEVPLEGYPVPEAVARR
jgi:hypothetical protein